MNCSHVGLSHYTHDQLSAYTHDNMIICQRFITLTPLLTIESFLKRDTHVFHVNILSVSYLQEKLTDKPLSSILSLTIVMDNFVIGKVLKASLRLQQSLGKAIFSTMTNYIKTGINLYLRFVEIIERGINGKAGTSINGTDGIAGTKINGSTGTSGTKIKGGR